MERRCDNAVRVCWERIIAGLCELRAYGFSKLRVARIGVRLLWRLYK